MDKKDTSINIQSTSENIELYRQTLLWLFGWSLFFILITLVPLLKMELSDESGFITIMLLVIFAGAIGALFSAITRLYTFRELPDALLLFNTQDLKNKYIFIFCLIPPVVGVIASSFFYVFMQSGIITSNLFVDFKCNNLATCSNLNCLLSYSPCSSADYAKAVVWGFVSGFSERLVPNVLSRLENEIN